MENLPNIYDILINTFNTLINQFVIFVPCIIGCFIIITIGYLLAKGFTLVFRKLLTSIVVDRLGDKLNEIGLIKQLKTEIKLSDIVAKVMYISFY